MRKKDNSILGAALFAAPLISEYVNKANPVIPSLNIRTSIVKFDYGRN